MINEGINKNMIKGIIKYSHHLLENSLSEGDIAIDATCGNGHDTLFLSDIVGEKGKVLAFDIQNQAIQATKDILKENNVENTEVIFDNHALVANHLTANSVDKVGGAIFNLGYLPGSDKEIVTNPASTLLAFDTILGFLKPKGIIVLVVYYAHIGGIEEKESILKHVIHLDQKIYNVLQYRFINQKNNSPFIIAVQRK